MNINGCDIVEGFRHAGLKDGDTILVHSALSSFGYVEGGAGTVINSLLEVVGADGTVIIPTLTGKYTDNKLTPPIFDVRSTPCWTGRIPETFRQLPEARRSLHPTHSVAAIGAGRDELVNGHETGRSPCDASSPYYKNAMAGGYIILIGVDQESNTSVHCFEEIAEVPYHLQKDVTDIYVTDYKAEKIPVRNRLHDWYKPATDFNRFDGLFRAHGIMKEISIGNSHIRIINAKDALEFAVDLLLREPLYLVKEK